MPGGERKPIEILLVEDNPGDVVLAEEALRDARIPNHLQVAWDGVAALEALQRGEEGGVPARPDLILLDLNLPRKPGLEVLEALKQDPRWCTIPVIVFTSSAAETDIQESYRRRVNAYVLKPVDLDQFLRTIRLIEDFWLEIVRLP